MTSRGMALAAAVVLLLVGCGQEEVDAERRSALMEYARGLESSGLGQRLDKLETKVDALSLKLDGLARAVSEGVRVAPAAAVPSDGESPPVAAGDGGGGEVVAEAAPVAEEQFALTIPEPSEPVTVVLWHAYRGAEKEALEKACAAFTARFPRVTLDVQEVPFMALRDKVVVTVPRGTGPDLFIYAHNPIGDWIYKGGILVPLSGLMEEHGAFGMLEQFLPDTVRSLVYEGTLYGLPLAFKAQAMFYNRKLVSRPPTTVEELVTVARECSRGDGEERVYGLVYEAGLLYEHAQWANGWGAVVLDDAGQARVDSPEFVRSVEMVRGWVVKDGILPDLNKDMAKFLFNSNQAAIVFKGPWFLGEIDQGVEFGVALLPEVAPGQPARPYLGTDGIFMAASAKNRPLAFQVMRFLASREAATIRYVEGGQLVANRALYEDAALKGKVHPALETFLRQAEQAVVMSARPEMQAVWSTTDNALRKAIFGGGEPAVVMAEAQQKIARDIAAMRAQ